MPFPDEPLTLLGGCNCSAIRYQINIPPASQRPFHPSSEKSIRLPYTIFCHCDDCRRATASLVLSGIFVPSEMVSVSLLPRSSLLTPATNDSAHSMIEDAQRVWIPASEVFAPSIAPSDSFLTTYKSSDTVYRTFCGRCGTPLTTSMHPMPTPWPEMLDIMLGSIDRKDLENDFMAPHRHFWWNNGIGWINKLFNGAKGSIPKHPFANVAETVD